MAVDEGLRNDDADSAGSSFSDLHADLVESLPAEFSSMDSNHKTANGAEEKNASRQQSTTSSHTNRSIQSAVVKPPKDFAGMLPRTSSTTGVPQMQWSSICVATVILFVVAVQFSIYFASLWPYMSLIDPTADQTFYGFTLAAYSLGQMIGSPIFGYWNNRLKRARPVIAVGVCFSITGNIIYMFTEASATNRKWIIMGARFICGFGGGISGTIRGFVATTSTVEHRARAIAIGTAALSLGMTAGPVIQASVTPIGYPGLVTGPFHISQYTAPAYVSVAASLFLLVLLFTILKENYIGIDENKKHDPFHYVPKCDIKAALLCILCWFAMFFSITNGETVELPFTMAVFNWNNSDAVFYNSIIMGTSTFVSFSLYITFAIYGKRLNERVAVITGLCMLFAFYVFTFPWPFYKEQLDFKSPPTDGPNTLPTIYSTLAPITTPTSPSPPTNQTEYRDAGCDLHMEWCNYTPRLPLTVYVAAYQLVSAGFPVCNVAVSTLFSKILGPRRQGFMQSLMIMTGSSARLFGPILISWLFDKYGPRIAWTITAAAMSVSIFGFLIGFNRLVPLKMRPKLKTGDKLRYDGGMLYRF